MIGETWNDWRDHDRHRNTGGCQLANGLYAAGGRCRAGFHGARNMAIKRRDGDRDFCEAFGRHGCEDIDIAGNERRFRDNADRMSGPG